MQCRGGHHSSNRTRGKQFIQGTLGLWLMLSSPICFRVVSPSLRSAATVWLKSSQGSPRRSIRGAIRLVLTNLVRRQRGQRCSSSWPYSSNRGRCSIFLLYWDHARVLPAGDSGRPRSRDSHALPLGKEARNRKGDELCASPDGRRPIGHVLPNVSRSTQRSAHELSFRHQLSGLRRHGCYSRLRRQRKHRSVP